MQVLLSHVFLNFTQIPNEELIQRKKRNDREVKKSRGEAVRAAGVDLGPVVVPPLAPGDAARVPNRGSVGNDRVLARESAREARLARDRGTGERDHEAAIRNGPAVARDAEEVVPALGKQIFFDISIVLFQ